MKIKISIGEISLNAVLNDSHTAEVVYEALPMICSYNTWGNEIYFTVQVEFTDQSSRDVLEVGELAIWPPGNAFCIFYGSTPASKNGEPRAADATIPFGKIEGDATVLKNAKGSKILIEAVSDQ
jgi:hypothetical protein